MQAILLLHIPTHSMAIYWHIHIHVHILYGLAHFLENRNIVAYYSITQSKSVQCCYLSYLFRIYYLHLFIQYRHKNDQIAYKKENRVINFIVDWLLLFSFSVSLHYKYTFFFKYLFNLVYKMWPVAFVYTVKKGGGLVNVLEIFRPISKL